MAFKDIPTALRPREKLLAHGAGALLDVELLALLLRTGTRGASVLQLAQGLLDEFKGVAGLLHADVARLSKVKGIGPAKRAELAAIVEIARRALLGQVAEQPMLDAVEKTRDFLRLRMAALPYEIFSVMLPDSRLRLIEYRELFRGTLTHTSVYPREVVKVALSVNAAAVVFAHNHPSGVPEPSPADQSLTRTLVAALALVDVKVHDHLVVGRDEVVSMAERGMM
ncbi:MAG: repair protein radC family [Rhizobacter sp.]|nr:repair protein radC family [Rhizobacter sp.]